MSHAFISYARQDHDKALVLEALLGRKSIKSISDLAILSPGDLWFEKLQEAIDECFVMIVICTKNSMASQEVFFEWAYAMGKGIPILPIKYEPDCTLPSHLNRLQFLDFLELSSQQYYGLYDSVKKIEKRYEPTINIPKKFGIEKIFFSREEMLNEYSIEKILQKVKKDSEILVIARTGEAWARTYIRLQKSLKNKPIRLKIAIVDPEIQNEQWMIIADHGQDDIKVSQKKLEKLLNSDIDKGCIEIFYLPSSPLHSFVYFTDVEGKCVGIFETGANLPMEERTILILRSSDFHKSFMLESLYKVFSKIFDGRSPRLIIKP